MTATGVGDKGGSARCLTTSGGSATPVVHQGCWHDATFAGGGNHLIVRLFAATLFTPALDPPATEIYQEMAERTALTLWHNYAASTSPGVPYRVYLPTSLTLGRNMPRLPSPETCRTLPTSLTLRATLKYVAPTLPTLTLGRNTPHIPLPRLPRLEALEFRIQVYTS